MKKYLIIIFSLITVFGYSQTQIDPSLNPTTPRINTAIKTSINALGTNTYTATLTGFTWNSGEAQDITFTNANSGTSSFNLNGSGAMTIKKLSSGSLVDLVSGDISPGERKRLYHNGTFLVIEGDSGSGGVTSIATSNGITGGTITTTGTISGVNAVADGSTKGVSAFTASDFNSTSGLISLDYANGQVATSGQNGFLSSTDWPIFNNKQSAITFGTGVQTALGVNIGSAGAPIIFNGAGGTPSSMGGGNITGIPESGVTNLTSDLAAKQPTLVSGTNIRTVNGSTLLGSSNLAVGDLLAANNLSDVTAATALTNLGGTTVGKNVFTLTNPSAITFIRLNADNSISALSASSFRTAIGAGTGNGDLLSTNNLSDVASASTVRVNLGGTTIGINLFTLTNPSAITFPRYNADNSVSALSASAFRTAIGAGTGGGTVTSVTSADASITVTNPTTTVDLAVVSAPIWTTARNLAGNSVNGSANVAFSNKFIVQGTTDSGLSGAQFLGALGTGIIKNTTSTGVLSIAAAGDFPTLNQNTSGSAATLTTTRNIAATGDAAWNVNFNGSADVTAAITFTTVNSNVGSFGSTTQVGTYTVNGKGLLTAASNVTITPAVGSITGLGTGVQTALQVNVGSAGAFTTFNGAHGTPSLIVLTNATGLPIATALSGGVTNSIPYFTSPTAQTTSTGLLYDGSTLTVSKQTTTQPPVSGSVTQFVGLDANPLRITFDTHNNASASGTAFMGRRSRGTAGTPLALSSGDDIISFNGRGYGTTGYAAASTGLTGFKANQTFTDANMGTYWTVFTTPDNSVTAAEVLRATGAGAINAIQSGGKYQINSVDVLSSTTLGSGVTGSSLTSFGSSPTILTPSITTGFTIGGAATSRKMIVGNGTNFVPSTETWAVPGTSGNILLSDGTNWTSVAGTASFWALTGTSTVTTPTISGNVSWTQSSQSSTNTFQSWTQAAMTGGSPKGWVFNGGTHTTLTASVNPIDFDVNLARTVQLATGSLVNYTPIIFRAPTIAFVGASGVTGTCSTVTIDNSIQAGPNATLTAAKALWVQAGTVTFDGQQFTHDVANTFTFGNLGSANLQFITNNANRYVISAVGAHSWNGATGAGYSTGGFWQVTGPAGSTTNTGSLVGWTAGAFTNATLSTEIVDVDWKLNRSIQFATGALTTERSFVIRPPSYSFVGASTITDAVSFEVTAAPTASTNATITRGWAARLLGNVAIGGSTYFGASTGTTAPSQVVDIQGNLSLNTAGNKIFIKTGTNAAMGTGTLVAGTATITTTACTTSSVILLGDTNTSVTNVGSLTYVRSSGSFVVTSTNILDTSTFVWLIVEPQ